MEGIIFKKPVIFLLVLGLFIIGFFIFVPLAKAESAPPAINYAPNFWFDSQEKYYPANPSDFYFETTGDAWIKKYGNTEIQYTVMLQKSTQQEAESATPTVYTRDHQDVPYWYKVEKWKY